MLASSRVPTMFILIVGSGRVGSAVAKRALDAGHEVSVLDSDPLSHERLDKDQATTWEDAGGRFTVGTALEVDGLIEAGIEDADVFLAATSGDNTNLVIAQIAQRRFNVPAGGRPRRRPGSCGLVCGAGPADDLPDPDRDRPGRGAWCSRHEEVCTGMYVIIAGAGKVGLEPREGADRKGSRSHADRVRPRPLPGGRGGARARGPVRRRHRAVGARARRDPARRPGDRRHRRRRGQHPDLPGRQGEVRRSADRRARQQPAQPPALPAAGRSSRRSRRPT